MNKLYTPVSLFESYHIPAPSTSIELGAFLTDAEPKFIDQVQQIRATESKEERDRLKAKLPCITASGLFTKREKSALISHSGFICIDIDAKDNTHIQDLAQVKKWIAGADFVAYCGYSVTGRGLFAVIPIAYPAKHEEHFLSLQQIFKKATINIDPKCKDVCRLRGYSWDAQPHINERATTFKYLKTIEQPKRIVTRYAASGEDVRASVERLINQITARGIDIAPNYSDWLDLGFALSEEFGESGRAYYHQVSQYYNGYSSSECDRQFTNCLKHEGGGVTIKTFFHLCKRAGITLVNEATNKAA